MSELKPCPLCSEHLWPCNEGLEHPASDTCPLDNMWFPERLVAAWNTRDTPTLSAALELPEVRALVDALREIIIKDTRPQGGGMCEPFIGACGRHAAAALAAIKEPKT